MILSAALFLLFLALGAFFSASETGFVAASPYRLEHLERSGSRRAGAARKVLARLNDLLVAILIGNTLVSVAAASLATSLVAGLVRNPGEAILVATAATTLLQLVFGEINPKTFAARNPERTAILLVRPLQGVLTLLSPFVRGFGALTRLLQPSTRRDGAAGRAPLGDEEMRLLLRANAQGLSALRRKMIIGALEIARRPVKEIMVPRTLVRGLPVESTLEQVIETMRATGYSRYPVYRGRLDNVEGLLHAKDLTPYLLSGRAGEFRLDRVMRRPIFVPEAAPLEQALLQMQESAVHMAVVVDEFGTTEGIVTLEDIMEEVVGEIQDEHDAALEDWLTPIDATAVLIKGSAAVTAVNDRLGLGLPVRPDYTTLAGFFLDEFGRLPREKDRLEWHGLRFTVEKMSKRRIGVLRVDLGTGRREGSR